MFVPTYSAYTKRHTTGDITLTIVVEGFDNVFEAREFLTFFLNEDVASEAQEGMH